ncbi:MAG: MFS transporter [bacterium]
MAGLGFGFFVTTAATVVLDTAAPRARGRLMGAYLLVGDAGSVLGAGVGGWIYERFGTHVPFFVKAVCAATAALAARRTKGAVALEERAERAGVRQVIRVAGLLPISSVNMVLFMADVGILAILFPLFLRDRGLAPGLIGVFVALVVSIQLAALALGSRLADRWGRVRFLSLGLMLYSAGLVLLSATSTNPGIVFSTLVLGVGSGTARAVPAALVGDLAATHVRGTAMGIFRTFTDIGMIAGPAFLGALAAQSGYGAAFGATAGLLAAGVVLLFLTHRALNHVS